MDPRRPTERKSATPKFAERLLAISSVARAVSLTTQLYQNILGHNAYVDATLLGVKVTACTVGHLATVVVNRVIGMDNLNNWACSLLDEVLVWTSGIADPESRPPIESKGKADQVPRDRGNRMNIFTRKKVKAERKLKEKIIQNGHEEIHTVTSPEHKHELVGCFKGMQENKVTEPEKEQTVVSRNQRNAKGLRHEDDVEVAAENKAGCGGARLGGSVVEVGENLFETEVTKNKDDAIVVSENKSKAEEVAEDTNKTEDINEKKNDIKEVMQINSKTKRVVENKTVIKTKAEAEGAAETKAEAEGAAETKAETEGAAETKGETEGAAETKGETEGAAETKGETEGAAETKAEAEGAAETKGETEGAAETKAEAEGAAETKAETEGAAETKAETEGAAETKAEAEGAAETKAEAEGAAETKGEAEGAAETKAEAEGAAETKGETEGVTKNKLDTEIENKKGGLAEESREPGTEKGGVTGGAKPRPDGPAAKAQSPQTANVGGSGRKNKKKNSRRKK